MTSHDEEKKKDLKKNKIKGQDESSRSSELFAKTEILPHNENITHF